MSEIKGTGQGSDEKRPFIREKISKPPMTRRQAVQRILTFMLIAATGGAAAGISFAVASPLAKQHFAPETTQEMIPVTIPTDVEPTTAREVPTEGSETETSEAETEPLEDIMLSAIEQYKYNIHDFNTMYDTLRGIVQAADSGIVEVRSVQQGVDWFNNPLETSGAYAGVVIASTEREFLILAPDSAAQNADAISVVFADGTEAGGTLRQRDKISGLSVIGVNKADLRDGAPEKISVLALGNSYNLRQGDAVIAVGAPCGAVHSSSYGFISYVRRNVQIVDGTARIFYTDAEGDKDAGTFILSTAGELIGWMSDDPSGEDNGMTQIMAISEYKGALEKMTNGIPVPYVGIYGQEVTQAMREAGVPIGVYVSECVPDSPAYNAGILSGDVITSIGDRDMITIMDYENKLAEAESGGQENFTVSRLGAGEYVELEFQVTIGAR